MNQRGLIYTQKSCSLHCKPKSQEQHSRFNGCHQVRDILNKVKLTQNRENADTVRRNILLSQGSNRDQKGGMNNSGTFQTSSFIEQGPEMNTQKISQVMSQDFRHKKKTSGEGAIPGMISQYQPKHLDLLDFNDYSSTQILKQPYQINKHQDDSFNGCKLPVTVSNSGINFAKRPVMSNKKSLQVGRSHNGKLREYGNDSDLLMVRQQLEQSKSQLDCNESITNSNKAVYLQRKLGIQNFTNQQLSWTSNPQQYQKQQQQWRQLYQKDPPSGKKCSTQGVTSHKLRISENSNLMGTLFKNTNFSVVNSVAIEKDIGHYNGIIQALPNSIMQALPNIANGQPQNISHNDNITVINRNVIQGFDQSNSIMNSNIINGDSTSAENYKHQNANYTLKSPNISALFSSKLNSMSPDTNLTNALNNQQFSKRNGRFQSNLNTRPKFPTPMTKLPNSQQVKSQHRSSNRDFLNQDLGDMQHSTLETLNLSIEMKDLHIINKGKKKDIVWFAGMPLDSLITSQNNQKKKTMTKVLNQTQRIFGVESKDNSSLRNKVVEPWQINTTTQGSSRKILPLKNAEFLKKSVVKLSDSFVKPIKRQPLPLGTTTKELIDKQAYKSENLQMNQQKPVKKQEKFVSKAVLPQNTNLSKKQSLEVFIRDKALDSLGKPLVSLSKIIRPAHNYNTNGVRTIERNKDIKLAKEKSIDTKQQTDKRKSNKSKTLNKERFESIDSGVNKAPLNINININAGLRNVSQTFKSSTFGKKQGQSSTIKTKSSFKETEDKQFFEKSVDKDNASKKSPHSKAQGRQSKLSGPQKNVIRNGELIIKDTKKKLKEKSTSPPRKSLAAKKKTIDVKEKPTTDKQMKEKLTSRLEKSKPKIIDLDKIDKIKKQAQYEKVKGDQKEKAIKSKEPLRNIKSREPDLKTKTNLKKKQSPPASKNQFKKNSKDRQTKTKTELKRIPPPSPSLELIEITNNELNMFSNNNSFKSSELQFKGKTQKSKMQEFKTAEKKAKIEDDYHTYERLHNKSGTAPNKDISDSTPQSNNQIINIQASERASKIAMSPIVGNKSSSNRLEGKSKKQSSTPMSLRQSPSSKKQITPNGSDKKVPSRQQTQKFLSPDSKSKISSPRIERLCMSPMSQFEKMQSKKSLTQKNSPNKKNEPNDKVKSRNIKETHEMGVGSDLVQEPIIEETSRNIKEMHEMGVGSEKVYLNSQSTKRSQSKKSSKQFNDMACGNSEDLIRSASSKRKSKPIQIEDTEPKYQASLEDYAQSRSLSRSDDQHLKKIKPKMYNDTDWNQTAIFNLVKQLLELDPKDRLYESKMLLKKFLNPNNHDIFTEEEAGYYSSFLRKKALTEIVIEDSQRPILEQMYEKAKLSVQVLSDHLNLTIDDLIEQNELSRTSLDQSFYKNSPRQPIIFRNNNYQDVTIESLIKLLLRIRQLYGAIQEIVKILSIIKKLQQLTGDKSEDIQGQVYEIIEKYKGIGDQKQKLEKQEEQILVKTLNRFQTLSRRISRFLLEHKLFKHFVFGNSQYQAVLLEHASQICQLFKSRGTKQVKSKYGQAYLSDFLEFNEVEVEDSEIQNLQDADEHNLDNFEVQIENMFDQSQKSGMKDVKSEQDLKRNFHFGMLSMHSDSQEKLLTINNDGSQYIQHKVHSIRDQDTVKSNTNNREIMIDQQFQLKNTLSPHGDAQVFSFKQELMSSSSNNTFILAKNVNNQIYSSGEGGQLMDTVDEQENGNFYIAKEQFQNTKSTDPAVDQHIKINDDAESENLTVKHKINL